MLSQSQLQAELTKINSLSAFTGGHKVARRKLFKLGIEQARRRKSFSSDLVMEFGVCTGTTITTIASFLPKQQIYGFDSFEGLPAEWRVGWPWGMQFKRKGAFDRQGVLPRVPKNVKLVKGWFNNTLAPFLAKTKGEVGFLHIDSDLYQSAKTVLTLLGPRISKGTVIQFDQFYNFKGMEDDSEIRAFLEFINETGHRYEYIGRTAGRQVTLVIL
jgi:hypothetical protein